MMGDVESTGAKLRGHCWAGGHGLKTAGVAAGARRLVAVRTLSGGNQQKAMLARWLVHGCEVLLLDEPTRGVDVGARAEIYSLVRELSRQGTAVLMVSSEIEEVLGLADRVLVVADGRVVHTGPTKDIDERRVLDLVMEGAHT